MEYTGFQLIERTDVRENDTRGRGLVIVQRREYLIKYRQFLGAVRQER